MSDRTDNLSADLDSAFSVLPAAQAREAGRTLHQIYVERRAAFTAELKWADFKDGGRFVRGGASDMSGLWSRAVGSPEEDADLAALSEMARAGVQPGMLVNAPQAEGLLWFLPLGAPATPAGRRIRGLFISEQLFGEVLQAFNDGTALTRAERRIALQVLAGKTPRDAAIADGVSMETKRSQLKSVCAKLYCSGQPDLIRLVLGQFTNLISQWSTQQQEAGLLELFAARHLGGGAKVCAHQLHNGRTVRYLQCGPAGGRPVLAFHCMLFPLMLRGAGEHLERNGLRLIMPIREGYLDARPLAELYRGDDSVGRSLEDAAELIRDLTEQPVTVLGHSIGAAMALEFAKRHPQRVDNLVLLSINLARGVIRGRVMGPFFEALQRLSNQPGLFRLLTWQFLKYYADLGTIRVVLQHVFEECPDDVEVLRSDQSWTWFIESYRSSVVGIAEDFRFLMGSWQSDCAGLLHRATFVHGTEDSFSGVTSARAFASGMPRATFLAVDGRGHLMCGSDPGSVWNTVADQVDARVAA